MRVEAVVGSRMRPIPGRSEEGAVGPDPRCGVCSKEVAGGGFGVWRLLAAPPVPARRGRRRLGDPEGCAAARLVKRPRPSPLKRRVQSEVQPPPRARVRQDVRGRGRCVPSASGGRRSAANKMVAAVKFIDIVVAGKKDGKVLVDHVSSGKGELAERQQKLAQMLSHLTKNTEKFSVAVYITNQGVFF
ncbi:hypothetical protein ACP70R_031532 [Stipagrostis hirtigluma subsp. patula]